MNLIKDIFKCVRLALYGAFLIGILTGTIHVLFYHNGFRPMLYTIKNLYYYIGCFGLFISTGFFMQREATRPLDHQEDWNQLFYTLPLGFVVLLTSLFLCLCGTILQLFLE